MAAIAFDRAVPGVGAGRSTRDDWISFSVAELDLDLSEATSFDHRAYRVRVRTLCAAPGPVDLEAAAPRTEGSLGLLLLDGLMLAQVHAGRRRVGWLLGEGDLIRPWEMGEVSLTSDAAWSALAPARIALLDEQLLHRPGGDTAIVRAMVTRAARTAHWLLAKSLIISCPLIEERLLLLFTLLGERWGIVTSEGVALHLPLTHALLAILCGARRPSITVALQALEHEGTLRRMPGRGWLLRRVHDRPLSASGSCWESYVEALGLA
jgi:hypothetical protein